MKLDALKKIIKETVKEAIQEELREVLLEAVKAPKVNTIAATPIQENINIASTPPPQTSQTSALDVKKKYMDVLGETALNYTSKDVQKFNPKGNIDTTSPNGQLPSGEVGMDQIMGLMTSK